MCVYHLFHCSVAAGPPPADSPALSPCGRLRGLVSYCITEGINSGVARSYSDAFGEHHRRTACLVFDGRDYAGEIAGVHEQLLDSQQASVGAPPVAGERLRHEFLQTRLDSAFDACAGGLLRQRPPSVT